MKTVIKNPNMLKEPGNLRDPCIVGYEGRYYMVATTPPFWEGSPSSPGVKMWLSDDLVHWQSEGYVIDRAALPEDGGCRDRFWAPELFIHEGTFYLLFSANNEALKKPLHMWLARAQCITGPYVLDSAYMPVSYGIDGNLFCDDDGQIYLTFAWGGIHMCKFDLEKGKPASEIHTVVQKSDEEGLWDSSPFVEGNFLVKRGGTYYLWYSCPGRSYEMGWATTDSLDKPFVKWPGNPILSGLGTPIHAAGHNCCFTLNDGRDAVAFHGHGPHEEERLCIDVVTYPMEGRAPAAEVDS